MGYSRLWEECRKTLWDRKEGECSWNQKSRTESWREYGENWREDAAADNGAAFWSPLDFGLYIKENWQPVNSLKERCEKI